MKKITIFSILVLIPFIVNGSFFSYNTMPEGGTLSVFYQALLTIANWIFLLVFVGSFISVIIGATIILFSAGDSGKISAGRKIILYALIAMIIASSSWALVNWVRGNNSGNIFSIQ